MRIRSLRSKDINVSCDINGMLRYRYVTGPDGMCFDFTLLCECGERFKNDYLRGFKEAGWVVEFGRELGAYPWVADFLIEVKP